MKTDLFAVFQAALVSGAVVLSACGSDSTSGDSGQAGCPASSDGGTAGCPAKEAGCPAGCPAKEAGCPAGCPASTPGDTQTPPTGTDTEISAWIAKGDYKSWKCESAVHDARSPSPHGKNRICSNDRLSAAGAGEFPTGSAAVKEIYDEAGTSVVGYATYLKTKAGHGESWYWFEKVPDGVVANGLGDTGTPKTVCVGCHSAAGSDGNHAGHDFVYTQVK